MRGRGRGCAGERLRGSVGPRVRGSAGALARASVRERGRGCAGADAGARASGCAGPRARGSAGPRVRGFAGALARTCNGLMYRAYGVSISARESILAGGSQCWCVGVPLNMSGVLRGLLEPRLTSPILTENDT